MHKRLICGVINEHRVVSASPVENRLDKFDLTFLIGSVDTRDMGKVVIGGGYRALQIPSDYSSRIRDASALSKRR